MKKPKTPTTLTNEYVEACRNNNLKEIDEFLNKKSKEDIIQIWATLNSTNEEQSINFFSTTVGVISMIVAVITATLPNVRENAISAVAAIAFYMFLSVFILMYIMKIQKKIEKRDYAKELLRLYIEKGSVMKSLDRA